MTATASDQRRRFFLLRAALQDLIQLLQSQGYSVVGPAVVDEVILLRDLDDSHRLGSASAVLPASCGAARSDPAAAEPRLLGGRAGGCGRGHPAPRTR